jgi:hypothetical protein
MLGSVRKTEQKGSLDQSRNRTHILRVSGAAMMLTFHLSNQNSQMVLLKFSEENQNKDKSTLLSQE